MQDKPRRSGLLKGKEGDKKNKTSFVNQALRSNSAVVWGALPSHLPEGLLCLELTYLPSEM